MKEHQAKEPVQILAHNRVKQYILKEGTPVPFLVDLGVMTKEGEIVRTKFDKFRQINRFLEFIEDVLPELPKDREVTILDFGCGKSYLTFAIYYYLHELKGYDIRIIGLIKERMAALVTDAMRAEYLKREGYDTQILEFIDMEHTPKNILLRAVRRVDAGMADGQSGLTEAEQKSGQCCKEPDSKRLAETLQIHTTLQKLLEGE